MGLPGSTRLLAPAAYVGLAVVDSALAASRSPTRRRFRMVTKPLLMPALATALTGTMARDGAGAGGVLGGGTVVAQAMSGAGDIALLSTREPAFLAGLGSFLGAHVAYTAAFASAGRPGTDRRALGGVAGAVGLFAALASVLGAAAGRKDPRLRPPVVAYAGVLSTMVAASTRLDPSIPVGARRSVVAGTTLFMVSDTLLAARTFLLPETAHPGVGAGVMVTYTAGQGLIALGVARAVRSRVGRGGMGPSFPSTVPPATPPGPSTRVE